MTQLQQLMLDAKTTGSGVANCSNYNNLTVYVEGSAALSAGTLIIEESRRLDELGTWSQIASVTLATPFASAGGEYANHLPVSAYAWVRCRIGTTVVGGTISVELRAN